MSVALIVLLHFLLASIEHARCDYLDDKWGRSNRLLQNASSFPALLRDWSGLWQILWENHRTSTQGERSAIFSLCNLSCIQYFSIPVARAGNSGNFVFFLHSSLQITFFHTLLPILLIPYLHGIKVSWKERKWCWGPPRNPCKIARGNVVGSWKTTAVLDWPTEDWGRLLRFCWDGKKW